MKKLETMKLLEGHAEEITMMDFRKSPGDVIAQVQQGKTFHITIRGKRVATITQPEPDIFELAAEARATK
jgi:antitoxin (DNA-binding transcriptional repressor) of toxin-antitoxin stability system